MLPYKYIELETLKCDALYDLYNAYTYTYIHLTETPKVQYQYRLLTY